MKKRVFIIHRWLGNSQKDWYPWLKKELENRGFQAYIPELPDTNNPRIYNWISAISEIVKNPDEETYFVGHSVGCQAIARYLETLPQAVKIGGVVFVAGFFKRLIGLEPEDHTTADHWLKFPIDLKKVKQHLSKSVAIFSDNDPWVPLDNQDDFKEKLDSEIIVKHKMGHFMDDDGVTKLTTVLNAILKISK